jgi:hypothetical protein
MADPNKTVLGNHLKSMHIAVYALSLLGGTHKKVHTEDTAKKCMDIAPDRFRWERYDYPDKELVRKALVHASEDKNGSLVIGRSGMEQRGKSRDGWQITPAGAEWVRINESTFENALTRSPGTTGPTIPRREAATSAPAAEIRSRKSRRRGSSSARRSAFVSFFRQMRARPASWNRSKLSMRKSRRAGLRTQMKPDRLLLLFTP